jgi:hypothetical protein
MYTRKNRFLFFNYLWLELSDDDDDDDDEEPADQLFNIFVYFDFEKFLNGRIFDRENLICANPRVPLIFISRNGLHIHKNFDFAAKCCADYFTWELKVFSFSKLDSSEPFRCSSEFSEFMKQIIFLRYLLTKNFYLILVDVVPKLIIK